MSPETQRRPAQLTSRNGWRETTRRGTCSSAAHRLVCQRSRAFLLGGRLSKRRNRRICLHRSTITTITAGLAREVCESCARVKLRFVNSAVQLRVDAGPSPDVRVERPTFEATVTFERSSPRARCRLCRQDGAFLVPDGLMCDEHAWQAAARIDWGSTEPWVPIQIDESVH
jgi:hypothetical protein